MAAHELLAIMMPRDGPDRLLALWESFRLLRREIPQHKRALLIRDQQAARVDRTGEHATHAARVNAAASARKRDTLRDIKMRMYGNGSVYVKQEIHPPPPHDV